MLRAPYFSHSWLAAGVRRYLRFLAMARSRAPGEPLLVPMYDIDLAVGGAGWGKKGGGGGDRLFRKLINNQEPEPGGIIWGGGAMKCFVGTR